jgi:hypothetical protein
MAHGLGQIWAKLFPFLRIVIPLRSLGKCDYGCNLLKYRHVWFK